MTVRAVLFDADGVVQENPVGWLDNVKAVVGPEGGEQFLAELFGAELPSMVGRRDFPAAVREVAERWGVADRVEELMGHWRRVEVSRPTLAVVRELRARGVGCWLASNQNPYRAAYMRESLRYGDVFDGEFYSCELGVTKASESFFTTVLEVLGLGGDEVLHLDDSPQYVEAARAAGLRAEQWAVEQGIDKLRVLLAAHQLPVPASGLSG